MQVPYIVLTNYANICHVTVKLIISKQAGFWTPGIFINN